MFSFRRTVVLLSALSGLLVAADRPSIVDQFAQLPLSFEPNLGQSDSRAQFVARSAGYTLFLGSSEASMRVSSLERNEAATLRMTVDGASPTALSTPLDRQPGVSAYFIGNDSSRWLPEVPHYGRVQYQGVYPGVDLVYYGNGRQVEYDFVVSPGADSSRIRLSYEGATHMAIDAASGDLILGTPLGDLRQLRPRVYQEKNGRQVEVPTSYRLNGRQVSFDLARYDHSRPLRIDPVFVYSSYLGPNARITDMAMDSAGAVYVTGYTSSYNFPTVNAFQPDPSRTVGLFDDVFVIKLNPYPGTGNFTLAYSTYLGGSFVNYGGGIAVDPTGAAYVSGTTNSLDFPVLNAYQSTLPSGTRGLTAGFVTKINPYSGTGKVTLAYSTYLGGDYQQFEKIAVDSTGAAYVVGASFAANFPAVNSLRPFQDNDAFVTRLNPYTGTGNVTLGYSTPLAGGRATAVAVDSTGAAYVTGYTFPPGTVQTVNAFQSTQPGGFDGFVAKLNPFTGGPVSLAYSTYLGGSGIEYAYGITVDSAGAAYVTGSTTSTDFPVVNAVQSHSAGNADVFVTKFNPYSGSGPVTVGFSTYLGGAAGDTGNGIALDSAGAVYVTGGTDSANYPILDPSPGGSSPAGDTFISKLNVPASGPVTLAWSAVLGGSPSYGTGIKIDAGGAIQVAGTTSDASFPLKNPYQSTYVDVMTDAILDSDGFVARLPQPGTVVKTRVNVTVTSSTVSALPAGQSIVVGQSVSLTATFSGATGSPVTGTVWFVGSNQGAVLCSAPVVNGAASCTAAASPEIVVGANTVTIGYPGDSVYTLGTVTPLTFTVAKAATTTTLSISPNPPQFGPATLTATVAFASTGVFQNNGTVTFTKEGTAIPGCIGLRPPPPNCIYGICSSPVTQIVVTCPTVLTSGTNTFGASYTGDAWTTASTAAPLQVVNVKTNPTFVLNNSPFTAVYGQPVTFSITALPGPSGVLPTGDLTITDQGKTLGTVTLNGSGKASLIVPSSGIPGLSPGVHSFGLQYNGDSNFAASNTFAGLVAISKANTVISLVAQTGKTVTLTAAVSVTAPGAGIPTGVVQFFNGATSLGTAPVTPLGNQFTATLNVGSITGNVTATYLGDSNFNSSSSGVVGLPSNAPVPFVTMSLLTSANPAPVGLPVTITVEVVGSGGDGVPSPAGSVQIFDFSTLLGTVPVVQERAVLKVTFQTTGTHNLRANYSGDIVYPSASTVAGLFVARSATSLTLSSSASTAAAGAPVTFTATVTGQTSGLPVPSGSVQFLDGGTSIGSSPLVNGTATLTVSNLAAGRHGIRASYSGDDVWGSASGTATVVITGSDSTGAVRTVFRRHR